MNYLVAVLPDRIQAEAAYSALEKEGLPMKQIHILGRGYKSADEFGLLDPSENARKQARLMAIWLVPFGFFSGASFSLITKLDTFAWAGEIGNHVVGGILGAIAGGLGSLLVGGGFGIGLSGDALPYRNRLNAGKYLVVVEGGESVIKKSTTIMREYNLESLQGYIVKDGTIVEGY